MQNKALIYSRLLAIIYIGTAIGFAHFWWSFFNGGFFNIEDIKPLIKNFDGYYAWEKSFALPDILLALTMLCSAIMLWFKQGSGKALAYTCAGASLFLGILDLNYGLSTGIYNIPHPFGHELMSSGISITVVGVMSIILLCCIACSETE